MTSKLSNVSDANFPRDPEGRVYHLGVKSGEVANRILSVGDAGRAKLIAGFLDDPQNVLIISNRGFIVFTGTYNNVPISIIATGMGVAMIDFVVRECRAVVEGTMVIIRFGTCGTLQPTIPIGSIVVADTSTLIRRNPDHWTQSDNAPPPYDISKPVASDTALSERLYNNMHTAVGPVVIRGANATGDSFYSSQGRHDPNFTDENTTLFDELLERYPNTSTLEMETFQLYSLAQCCVNNNVKASAATIVLAQRRSNAFLDVETKHLLEKEGGLACLRTLIEYPIDSNDIMNGEECVWNQPPLKKI